MCTYTYKRAFLLLLKFKNIIVIHAAKKGLENTMKDISATFVEAGWESIVNSALKLWHTCKKGPFKKIEK